MMIEDDGNIGAGKLPDDIRTAVLAGGTYTPEWWAGWNTCLDAVRESLRKRLDYGNACFDADIKIMEYVDQIVQKSIKLYAKGEEY